MGRRHVPLHTHNKRGYRAPCQTAHGPFTASYTDLQPKLTLTRWHNLESLIWHVLGHSLFGAQPCHDGPSMAPSRFTSETEIVEEAAFYA